MCRRHFFIDKKGEIWKSININRIAWAVGNIYSLSNGAGAYYNKCTNSIGSGEAVSSLEKMLGTISGLSAKTEISLQRQINTFAKQNLSYKQQENSVISLKNKITELSNSKIETTEFKEIRRQINNAENDLNKLIDKQELFLDAGGKKNTSTYKRMEIQIDTLKRKIADVRGEQEYLIEKGKAYTSPDISTLTQKFNAESQKLNVMAKSIQNSFDNVSTKIQEVVNKFNTVEIPTGQFRNFEQEIANATTKLKELEASGKMMGHTEWDAAYISLQRLKNEAQAYKNALNSKANGLDTDIQKTSSLGNKVEELKNKVNELKGRGLNFGDAEFDKAYSSLQRAEQELNNYKNNLKRSGNETETMSEKASAAFNRVRDVLKPYKITFKYIKIFW